MTDAVQELRGMQESAAQGSCAAQCWTAEQLSRRGGSVQRLAAALGLTCRISEEETDRNE